MTSPQRKRPAVCRARPPGGRFRSFFSASFRFAGCADKRWPKCLADAAFELDRQRKLDGILDADTSLLQRLSATKSWRVFAGSIFIRTGNQEEEQPSEASCGHHRID